MKIERKITIICFVIGLAAVITIFFFENDIPILVYNGISGLGLGLMTPGFIIASIDIFKSLIWENKKSKMPF